MAEEKNYGMVIVGGSHGRTDCGIVCGAGTAVRCCGDVIRADRLPIPEEVEDYPGFDHYRH